ncbi:MAG: hypothetical protein WC700_10195 [Gemmatimonadaceae bacterium]|jgi:hypothetical protein
MDYTQIINLLRRSDRLLTYKYFVGCCTEGDLVAARAVHAACTITREEVLRVDPAGGLSPLGEACSNGHHLVLNWLVAAFALTRDDMSALKMHDLPGNPEGCRKVAEYIHVHFGL